MPSKRNNLPLILISIAIFILIGIFVINFCMEFQNSIQLEEFKKAQAPSLAKASIQLDDQAKKQKIYAIYKEYKNSFFPDVSSISVEEVFTRQARERVLFIDVREPMEQEVSMIAGAITPEEFDRDADKYEDYTIITYCTIGYRSGIYSERLRKDKDIQSYNMIGGILSWAHGGGKVYAKTKETRRVHVYGKKWDLVPEGYKAIW